MAEAQQLPINVVGSSKFGVYPKISIERTYNMYISDEWLISYYGYQKRLDISDLGTGRAIFYSSRNDIVIVVVGNSVFKLSTGLGVTFIGIVGTVTGEISIDENLAGQIAVCDGRDVYIYSTITEAFTLQALSLGSGSAVNYPGYVFYHNTYFIICSAPESDEPQSWYIFQPDPTIPSDPDLITEVPNSFKAIQTKPDKAITGTKIPGAGNNILILGRTVGEIWTQVAGVEVYRRVQSFNIDNGIASVATLASDSTYVVWLAKNEKNKYFINILAGNQSKRVSTDGVDHLLQNLINATKSTAFLYEQDGHLFYQITFFDERDNLTLYYDITQDAFYHSCDEDENYHPARQVVNFENKDYFISINDASLYEMGSQFDTYNYNIGELEEGETIPRLRVCKTVRKADSSVFRAIEFSFWLEQGFTDFTDLDNVSEVCEGTLITEDGLFVIVTEAGETIISEDGYCSSVLVRPSVDLCFSKDGNVNFSNIVRNNMNTQGNHRNQISWHQLGYCNEFTPKIRFIGMNRFVCGPGMLEWM